MRFNRARRVWYWIGPPTIWAVMMAGALFVARADAARDLRADMPYVALSSCNSPTDADPCGIKVHGKLNVVFPDGRSSRTTDLKVYFIR